MMVLSNVESHVKLLVSKTIKTWPYVVKLLFSILTTSNSSLFYIVCVYFPANVIIY